MDTRSVSVGADIVYMWVNNLDNYIYIKRKRIGIGKGNLLQCKGMKLCLRNIVHYCMERYYVIKTSFYIYAKFI